MLEAVLLSAYVPPSEDGPTDAEVSVEDSRTALQQAVAAMPDFSHLLPADYRKDYAAWRGGRAAGAKGELHEAMLRMEAMQDSVLNNTSEDFTEVNVYRAGYAAWRRGKAAGSKDAVAPSFM